MYPVPPPLAIWPDGLREVIGCNLSAPGTSRPEGAVTAVAGAARDHRLTGPTIAALTTWGYEIPSELTVAHRDAMAWCVLLEARLARIKRVFDAAGGVEFLVIKGPTVAHLDEPDPALRSFGDLDLLVGESTFDRAISALAHDGFHRPAPQMRSGFDRRFARTVTLTGKDGIEVDVHRSLTGGPHGRRIPLPELFDQAEPLSVAGERLMSPSLPHRAMVASYHAAANMRVQLTTIRDLGNYLTRPDLNPELLDSIALRWRGRAVLASAVALTLDTFAPRDPTSPGEGDTVADPLWRRWYDWLDQVEVDHDEANLIARYHQRTTGLLDPLTIRELPWTDRVRLLSGIAFPSREWVKAELPPPPLPRLLAPVASTSAARNGYRLLTRVGKMLTARRSRTPRSPRDGEVR